MELDIIHGQAVEASETQNVKEGNEQVRGVSLSMDTTLYALYVCTQYFDKSKETGTEYYSLYFTCTMSCFIGFILCSVSIRAL